VDYAKENIESLKKAVSESSPDKASQDYSISATLITKFFEFIKRILFLGAGFMIFTLIFRNVIITIATTLYSLITKASMKTINSRSRKLKTFLKDSVMSKALMRLKKKSKTLLKW
jgi:membrane protein insertase Oxa1/YidC/SpoIIIJ